MRKPFENIKKLSGVYCIIHRASLMVYIGSSVNMHARYYGHLNELKRGSQTCLQRAMREFGVDSFDFEIIERLPKERLLTREKFWIAFFNSASVTGFNTHKNPSAVYDKSCSAATRERRSFSMKGRKKSPEHLANLAASLRGNKLSPETRKKLRLANLGKKHTDETRSKMSAAHRGKTPTEEHRKALSISLKGRVFSEKHLAAMSAANLGKKLSPETREKMRQGQIRRRAREANTSC